VLVSPARFAASSARCEAKWESARGARRTQPRRKPRFKEVHPPLAWRPLCAADGDATRDMPWHNEARVGAKNGSISRGSCGTPGAPSGNMRLWLIATLVVLAACSGTPEPPAPEPHDGGLSSDGDAALEAGPRCDAAGRVPLNHHPAGTTCPLQRPAWTPTANCTSDAGGGLCSIDGCFQDSDCTMGANGRCGSFGGPALLDCSYDACFQDSDCDAGQPCLCRPSNVSGPASLPNVCAPIGNCSVDSDCGPSGYCSPSHVGPTACACVTHEACDEPDGSGVSDVSPPQPPPGVGCWESDGGPWTQVACTCSVPYACGQGFYCHTSCDGCVDDTDCGAGGACNYSLVDQRWECIAQDCPL
jgi:hypothetical protein